MNTEPAESPEMSRLDGRVVVLTGASSGIGAQFARALNAAGASVALVARRKDRLEELAADFNDALVIECDVADEKGRGEIVAKAVERFGRLDGLVNNAGISNVTPALREGTDDFRRVLEVNLVAPFALAADAAAVMRENGGGSIVNISSICAVRSLAGTPQASYTSSKAGLDGLTRELATQWARYGIRVNSIGPGTFNTEMSGDGYTTGPYAEVIRSRTPVGRPGNEGELDSTMLMLLHPGSSYLTGQNIIVDGGYTVA